MNGKTANGVGNPPETNVTDHFEFWTVTEQNFVQEISVKGQFDGDDWPARTEAVQFIGNPVQKTLEQNPPEAPTYADTHLVAYRRASKDPAMTKHVEVTNQLWPAPVRWTVLDREVDPRYPLLLLLPAWKQTSDYNGPVPRGPQFVCYPIVQGGHEIKRQVTLVDQFSEQTIGSLIPRYLGVPVKTTHQPKWSHVEELDHLALYEYASQAVPSAPAVWTRDHLRKWSNLTVGKSVMLGVPSTKKLLQ
jgi:hypothetical protein